MSKEKIYIFDTTLRDGAQTQGVDFSIDDKLKIASIVINNDDSLEQLEINVKKVHENLLKEMT